MILPTATSSNDSGVNTTAAPSGMAGAMLAPLHRKDAPLPERKPRREHTRQSKAENQYAKSSEANRSMEHATILRTRAGANRDTGHWLPVNVNDTVDEMPWKVLPAAEGNDTVSINLSVVATAVDVRFDNAISSRSPHAMRARSTWYRCTCR